MFWVSCLCFGGVSVVSSSDGVLVVLKDGISSTKLAHLSIPKLAPEKNRNFPIMVECWVNSLSVLFSRVFTTLGENFPAKPFAPSVWPMLTLDLWV